MPGRGPGIKKNLALLILIAAAGSILAQVQPDRSGLGQAEFRHPGLSIRNSWQRSKELPPQAAAQAA